MINREQNLKTTAVDLESKRKVYIKCLLENGGVTRHTFKGNTEDTVRFMESLEGKVMEIQFLSSNATKDEERADATTKAT